MKTKMEPVGFNGIFSFIDVLTVAMRTVNCDFNFYRLHFLPNTTINITLLSFACGEKNSVTASS